MWQLLLVPSHFWACFQKNKEQNTIYWRGIGTEGICEEGKKQNLGWIFIFNTSLLFKIPMMDGRLFNKLLTDIISSLSQGNFSPHQHRFALAAWTRNGSLLSEAAEDLNKITLYFIFYYKYYFLFSQGWLLCICQTEEQIICAFKKNGKSPKLLGLASKFRFLFWWEKKLGNSAFHSAVWGTLINKHLRVHSHLLAPV